MKYRRCFFLSDLGFLAYQAGLTEGAGISVGSLDMGGASAQAGSKSIPKKYNLVKGKKLVIFGFILISNRKSMAILSLNNWANSLKVKRIKLNQ